VVARAGRGNPRPEQIASEAARLAGHSERLSGSVRICAACGVQPGAVAALAAMGRSWLLGLVLLILRRLTLLSMAKP